MWFQRTRKAPNTEPDEALRDARENLRRVVDRAPEVAKVSAASREFRRQNHFAIDLQAIFEGGGTPL